MSKVAFAAILPLLLLAGCGGREQGPTGNESAVSGPSLARNAAEPDPGPVDVPSNNTAGPEAAPIPPPDAVSHPNGYLPPAPAEPEPADSNSSASGGPPPATEDEYIRKGQEGR